MKWSIPPSAGRDAPFHEYGTATDYLCPTVIFPCKHTRKGSSVCIEMAPTVSLIDDRGHTLYVTYYAEDSADVKKLYRFLLPVSNQRKK